MMKRKMWYTTALTSICISVLTAVQVSASDITSVSVTLKKDKEVEAGVLYPVEITVSGWYQDGPNGSWYYFDQTGRMLTNTKTPDNFYVDENGRWKT